MCNNTKGSYNCTCKEGFTGDGFNCSGQTSTLLLSLSQCQLYKLSSRCMSFYIWMCMSIFMCVSRYIKLLHQYSLKVIKYWFLSHGGKHFLRFDQQPASPLFNCLTLTSAGISLSSSFEALLCFLACFFNKMTLLTRFSRFTASLALLVFCLSHRQVLLGFVHAASEDEVGACTREILMFSRSFHS